LARLFVFIGMILLLGTMATLDVLGVADLLPWMGNDSVAYEVLTGALFALLVPAVLSLLFIPGRLVSAALILGIAIAIFLHATLLLVVLFALYNGIEEAINAGAHRGSWRKSLSWFCGLGALLIGLPALARFALWLPPGKGWSWEIPGLQSVALAIGDFGEWLWDRPWWFWTAAFVLLLAGFTRLPKMAE
jgi:hypothetical protein